MIHYGRLDREGLLEAGGARFPARGLLENLADLQAFAAVHVGGELLRRLSRENAIALVERFMQFVQDDAAYRVLEATSRRSAPAILLLGRARRRHALQVRSGRNPNVYRSTFRALALLIAAI